MKTSIPKIIHQTWKTTDIPNTMKNYYKSWKQFNPEFEHKLWTDTDIRELIRVHYPLFLPYFDSYPHQIMRVDAFRFFVLHKFGGIYADLDMECYKPLTDLIKKDSLLLFFEWENSVSNAIMMSTPKHSFWEYCFKELIADHKSKGSLYDTWKITGPKFLTKTVKKYETNFNTKINILPSFYFFPIPWHKPMSDQSGQGYKYPKSYGAHMWQGSWWQPQPDEQYGKVDWIPLIMIFLTVIFVTLISFCLLYLKI